MVSLLFNPSIFVQLIGKIYDSGVMLLYWFSGFEDFARVKRNVTKD